MENIENKENEKYNVCSIIKDGRGCIRKHTRSIGFDKLSPLKNPDNRETFAMTNFHEKHTEKMYLGNPPGKLQTEAMRIKEAELSSHRAKMLKKSSQTDFKYYCAICLIIRDENEYLDEWLNWHIKQGVEHFYIYDHGSKLPVTEFIKSLGPDIAGKITVIEWSGTHKNAQPDAYNDCLNRFRGESKWIGYIDADEHVRVKTGQTLPELLKDYEECAGLFAVWLMYGANGQRNKSAEPLRKRFTRISRDDEWANKAGKVFVQPIFMQDMYIHNGCPFKGFDIVGEHKDVVPEYLLAKENPSADLICVDHYYTKSYEEWVEKLRRGRCHADFARKYDDFFKYNPDMEYCREKIDIVQEYEISNKTMQLFNVSQIAEELKKQ